jgi:hypothetical protein
MKCKLKVQWDNITPTALMQIKVWQYYMQARMWENDGFYYRWYQRQPLQNITYFLMKCVYLTTQEFHSWKYMHIGTKRNAQECTTQIPTEEWINTVNYYALLKCNEFQLHKAWIKIWLKSAVWFHLSKVNILCKDSRKASGILKRNEIITHMLDHSYFIHGMSQWNTLYSYLKQAKKFFFQNREQGRGEQWLKQWMHMWINEYK